MRVSLIQDMFSYPKMSEMKIFHFWHFFRHFIDSLFVCLFIFTFFNHSCKFYFFFLHPDDQKNIWGFQRSIKMEKMTSSLMSLWQCTTVKISNHQQQPIRWSRGNVLLSSYLYSVRTFVQWRSLISVCLNIFFSSVADTKVLIAIKDKSPWLLSLDSSVNNVN